MAQSLTTCTFCGVGCGLYLEATPERIAGVYPSVSHPANKGKICIRGWHVHEVASSPDRLKAPLLRKNGQLEEVTWQEAYEFIASRLKEIKGSSGPDSIAFLNSPRCCNEESYLLQKLARSVIGTNNVDHGAGVYSNNSVNVLLDMLGVAAATNSIDDLEQSDLIIVDGVDLARQLPTVAGTVLRARLSGAKLVVIGERRQRVAENADWFLQINPGTEAVLYGAMAKLIVDHGLMDLAFIKANCSDYDSFLAQAKQYDLIAAAQTCGVPAEQIEAVAVAYAKSKSSAILYSTGAETRDSDSIRAAVNLALLAGQIGKVGSGIFPLAEHNNLQGACDMGMLPDRLPGYRPLSAGSELESVYGVKLPATPGVTAAAVLKDRAKGKIKAVWLDRYDPVNTAALGSAAKALEECELVIVQHLFLTETAKLADVVLPTTAFGEETVSFTSTERRIQLARQAVPAPAGITPAWQQIAQVAKALGSDWNYGDAAAVMAEIGRAVPSYSAADYDSLGVDFGRQWPCTKDAPHGTPILFSGGSGSFKFVPVAKPAAPAALSTEFPFTLVLGNSSYYWNQNVLIAHSEILKREYRVMLLDYPQGFVEINADDAKEMKIRDKQKIKLCGGAGCAVTVARVTPEVKRGTVFVPYQELSQMQAMRGADDARFLAVRVETEVA
jgi:predicted molibdopterin-dependent oxidoreductase YjgC